MAEPVTFPVPSKEAEVQTTSPVIPIVLPVASAVAVADRATAIFAVPSKDVPPIVLAVARAVAVAALPVISLEVNATVPVALGNVIVRSVVGSVTVNVVSCASAVAPSKITAFCAFMVTVSTCVVVPATVRFGTSSSPVLGLYRNAPVSSNSPFDSSWKTTGKFVFAVLSETVAFEAVPLVS